MMAQYHAIKSKHPDAILFYRMGDFYEMFGEDAKEAARLLNITLTSRSKGAEAIPMAGVPVRAAETYLHKLIRAGKRVAVCEQVQDAREAKGLVERDVVRIVTAGTITEEEVLEGGRPNYLAAICVERGLVGTAWLELSTGQFTISHCREEQLEDELARIDPAELLLAEDYDFKVPAFEAPVRRCPRFDFDPKSAQDELSEFFGTRGVEGFGLDEQQDRLVIAAAGALIRYVRDTQRSALPHVRKIERFVRGSRMALDRATRASLELVHTQRGEFGGSLLATIDRSLTPMGKRLLRDCVLVPFVDLERIRGVQASVAECFERHELRSGLREQLARCQDLERLCGRLSCGRAHARDLVSLRQSMALVPELAAALEGVDAQLLVDLRDKLDPLARPHGQDRRTPRRRTSPPAQGRRPDPRGL